MRGALEQGAVAVLGRCGPLSTDELGAEMLAIGATRSRNPSQAALQAVRDSRRFQQLDDGRWLDRVAALRLTRLPHEITELERRVEGLRMDPDFTVLGDLVEQGSLQGWPGWGGIRLVWLRDPSLDARYRPTPERFLWLPLGALDSFAGGSQVLLSIDREVPALVLRAQEASGEAVDAAIKLFREVASERLQDHLGRGLDRWALPAFTRIDEVVFEALGREPELLAQIGSPIGTILRRGGLETYREFVGRRGTLWSRVDPRAHVWDLIEAEDVDALPWDDWDGRFPRRANGLSPELSL